MTWRRFAAVLPGVGASLLPKLTCPLCWPAYAGLLTTLGLGFLMSERYLFGVTAIFLIVSVSALAFRYRERRGITPALLGTAGAAVVLAGKFRFESIPAMYSGLSVLIAASLWNSWPRKSDAYELVQLSVKEGNHGTETKGRSLQRGMSRL